MGKRTGGRELQSAQQCVGARKASLGTATSHQTAHGDDEKSGGNARGASTPATQAGADMAILYQQGCDLHAKQEQGEQERDTAMKELFTNQEHVAANLDQ